MVNGQESMKSIVREKGGKDSWKNRFWVGSERAREWWMTKVVCLWKEIKSPGKEHQSLRYRDWYKIIGETREVYSRNKVKYNEKNDQSFVKMTMKVDERGWPQMRSGGFDEAEQWWGDEGTKVGWKLKPNMWVTDFYIQCVWLSWASKENIGWEWCDRTWGLDSSTCKRV